jgi:hypothetical protein
MSCSETRWTQSLADDCALTRINEITPFEPASQESDDSPNGYTVGSPVQEWQADA